jgi:prepilin-type processing-associated H-X9-DG protein
MMRLVVLALCVMAVTAALAQAPEPDLKDPAAVAKAYLEACGKWDFDAAGKFALSPSALTAVREQLTGEAMTAEQLVKELLCLPVLPHTKYVPGDPAVNGDECRVPVVVTYTVPQTLVLRKQPDGTWKVDVHETILSTNGAAESVFIRTAEQEITTECLNNLRQLGTAILQYAQDHDEVLPHADKWCDKIMPYMRNEQVLKCPESPDLECGYAFNAPLSGVALGKIDRPAETIIVFESDQGKKNSSGPPTAMPKPGRHNGGNNAVYVDGHAKWLAGQ